MLFCFISKIVNHIKIIFSQVWQDFTFTWLLFIPVHLSLFFQNMDVHCRQCQIQVSYQHLRTIGSICCDIETSFTKEVVWNKFIVDSCGAWIILTVNSSHHKGKGKVEWQRRRKTVLCIYKQAVFRIIEIEVPYYNVLNVICHTQFRKLSIRKNFL